MNNTLVNIVIFLALGAVAVILFMGLWNMFRGGSRNKSQMLMRARVIAQAVALVILLGALYFFGRGNGG
jgi:ABC-type nickel/cobalt efflux system permease component RcnA